ncbi:MAG: beta-L-arabinofuranosidase domain-containing protein, partial [Trebonia sp.]
RYADLIERTLFNNVLASPSADGRAFYYANTLHQRTMGTDGDGSYPASPSAASHRAPSGLRAPWFDVSCCPTNVARTLASVGMYFATVSDDGVQLHQFGDYRVATDLAAGPITLQVSSGYPADGTILVTFVQAPARTPLTLRLRVPAWAQGACEASESPAARTNRSVRFRRIFHAGDQVRVKFPLRARATYPDARIDAVRGTFAVERGPLVLVLESPDLPPRWSVDELTADPGSIATDAAGTTIDVYRQRTTPAEWPYYAGPDGHQVEHARTRLIPYHQWANRGPATMRTWLPLAAAQPLNAAETSPRT